jgi:hypothetical protein
MRIHVMPGALSWMMVAIKLTAPKRDEVMITTIATNQ